MTEEDYLDLYADHRRFCEASIKIRDFHGTRVPFKELPGPAKFNAACERVDESGEPGRIVVLKSRRAGFSSAIGAQFWRRTAFRPGRECSIVAHDGGAAKSIAGLYNQYENSYEDSYANRVKLGIPLVRKLTRIRRNEKEIEYERGSKIRVITAGNRQAARSFSSHYLHLSEMPFYEDPAEFLTGALQTAPKKAGCFVVVESTANGVGDPFHELWNAAERGLNEFIPIFFGWWEDPENRMDVADAEQFGNSLTASERAIQQAYGLSFEQLRWKRWKVANDCQASEDVFRQEYPANAEEAFLTTGTVFFDRAILERQPVEKPAERGRLVYVEQSMEKTLMFQANQSGELTIWRRPETGLFYFGGVDAAQGIDAGDGKGRRDPDFTHCSIFESESGIQVAEWRGRVTPNEAARQLYAVLKWFNWCFITPEANSVGIVIIEGLLDAGYPLERMYQRVRMADELKDPRLEELGYYQTGGEKGSRWHMVSLLDSALRAGRIQVRSSITRGEMHTFAISPRGVPEGIKGSHDDAVFACGLACVGLEQALMIKAMRKESQKASMTSIPYGGRAAKDTYVRRKAV
jgi:hypothetical protein